MTDKDAIKARIEAIYNMCPEDRQDPIYSSSIEEIRSRLIEAGNIEIDESFGEFKEEAWDTFKAMGTRLVKLLHNKELQPYSHLLRNKND